MTSLVALALVVALFWGLYRLGLRGPNAERFRAVGGVARAGATSPVLPLLASVILALIVMRTSERPFNLHSVAIAVPGIETSPGRGFRIEATVDVETGAFACRNPATVFVKVSGTREFWADHARQLRGWTRFELHLHSNGIETLLVGPAVNSATSSADDFGIYPSELVEPRDFVVDRTLPHDRRRTGSAYEVELYDEIEDDVVDVTGRIRDWGRHWAPIVATFKADVTTSRGLGSCYVQLPDLGEGADVIRGIGRVSGVATDGLVRLDTGGDVVVDESTPPPDALEQLWAEWRCAASAERLAWASSPSRKILAAPARRAPYEPCGAVAVVDTPRSEMANALALIVIGALASLGVEMLYHRWRERRRSA